MPTLFVWRLISLKKLVGRNCYLQFGFCPPSFQKIEWREDIEKTKIIFVTWEYRFSRKVRIENLGDNKMPTERGGQSLGYTF